MNRILLFFASLLCSFQFIAQSPIEFDIIQGSSSSYAYNSKEINGKLYFSYDAPEANGNYAIGYIDDAGKIVKPHYDLPQGFEFYDYPSDSIYDLNGKIYFTQEFYDATNDEYYYGRLMVLENDTVRIINQNIDEEIYQITKLNNKLYFSSYTDATGWELFSYDGNTITLENDLVPGTAGGDPWNFQLVNNKIHFTTVNWLENYTVFYHTDGLTYQSDTLHNHRVNGVRKVYDLNNEYIYMANVEGWNGAIIHTNDNDSLALVKHGTEILYQIREYKSIQLNGNIIFATSENTNLIPTKICRYDVANDTVIILNTEKANVDNVNDFALYNNEVYLIGSIHPMAPFPFLGKVDIANDTVITQYFTNQSGPIDNLKTVANTLCFSMYDNTYGKEAFKYNAGAAELIADLYSGNYSSYPYDFFSYLGNIGYTAEVNNGEEIYIMCSNSSLPTAPASQIACENSTIADLNVTGTNLSYHSAFTGGSIVNENNALTTSGSIYVASNIVCPSDRVEVPFTVSMLPNTAAAYLGDSMIMVINPTATYQWIDCANDQAINNETSQTLKVPGNGSYKCILTNQNGCSVETNCIYVVNLSVNENEINNTKVYPNPSYDVLHIDSDENMKSLTLKSINGATVHTSAVNTMQHTVDVSSLSEGIYFLEILNENNAVISKQKVVVKK